MRRPLHVIAATAALVLAATVARADALDALKAFSRDAKTGRATFTQTVTSPDGRKVRTSSGEFEFARPDRFRFAYLKPYPQTIVADGQKVWIHDPDLNQVTVRKLDRALGATPAALLAGGSLEQDFTLQALPDADGLSWVQATPKVADGVFSALRIGFQGASLAAIDLVDNFGQKSVIRFGDVAVNAQVDPARFRFAPPAGAEVLSQ